ncbi:MAG: GEVED domain-containing protein [Planctomycetota bacterium]
MHRQQKNKAVDNQVRQQYLRTNASVIMPGVLLPHFRAAALVTASAVSRLDAWIDYNGDGVFSAAEQIADDLELAVGQTRLEWVVPLSAAANVLTTARFRLSTQGNLDPTGVAGNGEVEDYSVMVSRPAPGDIGIYPDPLDPGGTDQILVMAGTTGNDEFVVDPAVGGLLRIRINANTYRPAVPSADIDRFGAFGLQGNDIIDLDGSFSQASELYGDQGGDTITGTGGEDFIQGNTGNDNIFGNGGDDLLFGNSGNDKVVGNDGDDVISGGSGDDRLFGHRGDDVILGGSGADQIWGQSGGDLLVGNTSIFDNDYMALERILDEWASANSYAMRMSNINNGTGAFLNGTGVMLMTGVTVMDDGERDRYYGGTDRDGFISLLGADTISDLAADELVL